ncbi:MAG: alpha/beta hydrolase [Burkholderiales bacterium]|nr:alpha/beta hydrolase [Burkholderiales bacterium]
MKHSASLFLDVRGIRYHVRCWGRDGAARIFMLHGWMDVSASFQFVVDELQGDWQVLAPDWRGYGLSAWTQADCYWYPDYFADLDRLLAHFQPERPVDLVGHSMGGNIACMYAGIRPERVARLVNLEGLGLKDNDPAEAPGRYARWIGELAGEPGFRDYRDYGELALRLQQANPRLPAERAAFLARHWGREEQGGRVALRSDPRHKIVNPVLYRAAEAAACARGISAPTLWVQGEHSESLARQRIPEAELARRKHGVRHLHEMVIPGAGHMMHHDQPQGLARAIESVLGAAAAGATQDQRSA